VRFVEVAEERLWAVDDLVVGVRGHAALLVERMFDSSTGPPAATAPGGGDRSNHCIIYF